MTLDCRFWQFKVIDTSLYERRRLHQKYQTKYQTKYPKLVVQIKAIKVNKHTSKMSSVLDLSELGTA